MTSMLSQLLSVPKTAHSLFKSHRQLALDNLALRQQLAALASRRLSKLLALENSVRGAGRSPVDTEIRKLILEMQVANVGWGAP